MKCLAEHRRWTFYCTPTSCSYTVESFFEKLARRRLWCGVYDAIEDLKASTRDFIALHNEKEAKPFKWTASPERFVATHQRGFQMTRTSHQAANPAFDMLDRRSGMIRTQQMKDYGIVHPATGQVATQPA